MAFHCNRPSFLALQAKALKRFMMDDYILVVIDDAQVMSLILVPLLPLLPPSPRFILWPVPIREIGD
jgi:hypothetical protein